MSLRFLSSIIVFISFTLAVCDSAAITDNKLQSTVQNGHKSFLKWSIERCKAADDYKFKVKASIKFSRWLVRNCKELETAYLDSDLKGRSIEILRATTRRPTQRPPATTQRPPIGTSSTTRSTSRNPNQPTFPTSPTNFTDSTIFFPPGNIFPQSTPSSSDILKSISPLLTIVLIII